jgi:hypothetical protein
VALEMVFIVTQKLLNYDCYGSGDKYDVNVFVFSTYALAVAFVAAHRGEINETVIDGGNVGGGVYIGVMDG